MPFLIGKNKHRTVSPLQNTRMKKLIVLLLLVTICGHEAGAKKAKTLKRVMTLKTDRSGGMNGASVAWNPDQKKYYAAMSGNTYFPMFVYTAEGKIISDNLQETMFDVRGLWYNTTTQTLQTNGYKNFGMAEYVTDATGMPVAVKKMALASRQPNEQATAAYNTALNVLYFYDHDSSRIVKEDFNDTVTVTALHLGVKKRSKIKKHSNSEVLKDYNENTCVYSGVANAEVGLLNYKERQIELYNPETGLLKKVLQLPPDAPLEPSLNFSNCNGIYWFFDKKKREWRGYQ